MNKGIVMELSDNSIIVMNPEGRFEKLPRGTRNCEVGEEILYASVKQRLRVPQMAIASGLAAAIILCFVLVSTLTGTVPGGQVVAYVTIDINPSIEIGIDNEEVVQDLKGLNTDGDELIHTLVYKGKSLEVVTSEILDKAEQGALAKGEADIIISSTIVEPKTSVNDEAIATKLKNQVSKHIEQAHPDQVKNYEVTAFAAPQEVRQEAKASGVSAGKYAIYLNAVDNGAKVSLDDIKSVSIHQLAKNNGGINKLVVPEKPIDKSSLQRLVADEKSGKLSEKIQQIQNEKTDKDNKDDKNGKNDKNSKNSVKPTKTPPPKNSSNNDKNYRYNGKDNDDDRKPTMKPDNRNDKDDDDKNNSSGKPSSKPSVKPTSKSTASSKPIVSSMPTPKLSLKPSPSPSPKPGSGSDSDSKGRGNDRDKDDNNRNDRNDRSDDERRN